MVNLENLVFTQAQNHHLLNLLQAKLAKEGVMVRHYEKEELKNFIRISVGRPDQTDTFLSALAKVA
jgi:histidinol-phosphate aminotransferase